MFNMQWRSLVMLLSGFAAIYIAMLLQDSPYLHPETIYTSNSRLWKRRPEQIIISTVGSFMYLTSVQFETPTEQHPSVIGTDRLKLGVQGVVKQYKKPISNLMSERELIETDGWTPCFEHQLKGHISQVSKRNVESTINKYTWHFAVLYHHVDNVDSYHYVRIYYTTQKQSELSFEYKDIKLPGTTWINAISLEKDSLLFSRDPDKYEFHIMTLPLDLMTAPHSEQAKVLALNTIRPGRLEQEWAQPASTEQHSMLLNRLYSPVDETYRVLSLNVHKTKYKFYVNFTIADNVTRYNAENEPREVWLGREKGGDYYSVYNEDSLEYVGYADFSNFQNPNLGSNYLSMPELHSTVSRDSKCIVFPYLRNKFVTMDFTTRVDILQKIKDRNEQLYFKDQSRTSYLEEYFYWQPPVIVDSDIMGVQLDDEGDILAVWTEYEQVYIYKRESNETQAEISLLGKVYRWLDHVLSDMPSEERYLRSTYFPASWELIMEITPKKEYGMVKPIGDVHFWKNSENENFIFVGNQFGGVNSYSLDRHEPEKLFNFKSFASERWDMLFAMSMVIAIFVYNEYQRPPY